MAETATSVKKINKTIIDFVRYHPDNVRVWSDNGKLIIQLSNISVRDKGLRYASFIANGTTLEDDFEIFGLPCKCTYASDSVLRFEGNSKDIIKSFENGEVTSDKITIEGIPEEVKLSIIKKFTTRVVNSKAFYREMEKVTKEEDPNDGSTVKIYVIGNPQYQYQSTDSGSQEYVTWKVLGILEINAGTTWGDPDLYQQILAYKGDINSDIGSFGSFNVAIDDTELGNVYKESDNTFDGKLPQFYLDDSVKVGDIIDSRDYHADGLWSSFDYQTDDYDYQKFENSVTVGDVKLSDTMIYDGTVITI